MNYFRYELNIGVVYSKHSHIRTNNILIQPGFLYSEYSGSALVKELKIREFQPVDLNLPGPYRRVFTVR